ncbi:MAG: Holliday junction branch migration protein RuvA [Patescibacteria group bacterium]
MIAYLRGIPTSTDSGIVITVNNVGYLVYVGQHLQTTLATETEPVGLVIYTHVSENTLELFGFLTEEEKRLFLLLLDVSGVGPKTALAITNRGAREIIDAVQQAQVSFFTQVPRVGKKMAQKIIIDLTSKLGSLKELELGSLDSHQSEVVAALTAMGFEEQQVLEAVRSHDFVEGETLQTSIKSILRTVSDSK